MMKKTKIRREEMMRMVGKGDEENVVWREEMMRMVGMKKDLISSGKVGYMLTWQRRYKLI